MNVYPKLEPKFKKHWVKALRSGEYVQGAGQLFNGTYNKYCCLGVACVILGVPIEDVNGLGTIKVSGFSDRIGEVIPTVIRGSIENNSLVRELTMMNDGIAHISDNGNADDDKKSFIEIADWIEQNL